MGAPCRFSMDVEERVHAAAGGEQALPVGEEAGERLLLDRLDLFAQFGEGFAADEAQDLGVAPFTMEAAGAEAAFDDAVFDDELVQGLFGLGGVEGEAGGDFREGEGAVGAGIAADEFEDWIGLRLREARWGCREGAGCRGRRGTGRSLRWR